PSHASLNIIAPLVPRALKIVQSAIADFRSLTRGWVALRNVLLRAAAVSATACRLRHLSGVLAVGTAVFFSFSYRTAAWSVGTFIAVMHLSISSRRTFSLRCSEARAATLRTLGSDYRCFLNNCAVRQ